MREGPTIAKVAALIGDPVRANMLTSLMDGRALTASELAAIGSVTPQTASAHLSKLVDAHMLVMRKQGRSRYYQLAGADVAQALENLMTLAQRSGAVPLRTGPRDDALREARVCYDHLAGSKGVELLRSCVDRGFLAGDEAIALTPSGRAFFDRLGAPVAALEAARRPTCRVCLDWSERRSHLAGGLGAWLLSMMGERGWVRRTNGRVLVFSPQGARSFASTFPVNA